MSAFRIETYRIFDVTEVDEYFSLDEKNRMLYERILSLGTVDLLEGGTAQTLLWKMFDENTRTGARLRDPANLFVLIPQLPDP